MTSYLDALRLKDNAYLSFPVPGMIYGRLADTFFTFDQASADGKWRLLINEMYFLNSGSGTVRGRFAVRRLYPLYDPTALLRSLEPDAVRELENLYAGLRTVAFEPSLNRTELTLVRDYRERLRTSVAEDLKPVYRELFPAFFQWLDTV